MEMKDGYPSRILITGGHEIGGIGSFAEGLRAGFAEFGIPVEVAPPGQVLRRWRDLRNPRVLKILSTTAVFAAPLARRAICMAHGVPRAGEQGWVRLLLIVASFKLANRCSGVQLVSVSHYTAATLRAIFNVKTDCVVHNPAKPIYLEPFTAPARERSYVTYVGRLIAAKNLHRILPAVRDLLNETPGLRMCIVGEGEMRGDLESIVAGDPRFEFKGAPDDKTVRDCLRRTRVFVSGNEVEGFGIAFLEAMTQGCNVVMPASGGGLEIAPELIGCRIFPFSVSFAREAVGAALRQALTAPPVGVSLSAFSVGQTAAAYLSTDARFSARGIFQTEVGR
jgi:glycosyltransferase involved in cell wall biosynthesis